MKYTNENEMKYQALSMIKEIHSQLAQLSFLEAMGVMAPDNPAKKDITALEKEMNDLTTKIGEFVQTWLPDVQGAEPDDLDELPPEEEEPEEKPPKKEKPKKEPVKESFRSYLQGEL